MVNNTSKNEKSINFDNFFIVLYELIVLTGILQVSMFRYSVSTSFLSKIQLGIASILFLIALLKKHTLYEYILGGGFVAIAIINFLHTGYYTYVLLGLIMFSMKEVNVKKLLFATLFTILIGITIIFSLSEIGKLPNLVYYRAGIARQSFGMIYPLSMSTYVFFISVCITLLFRKKKIITVTILLILGYLSYIATGSRNDAITIILLAIIVVWDSWLEKISLLETNFLSIIIIMLAVLVNFVTELVPYGTRLYDILNALLSGRMNLQDTLLNSYGVNLFGHYIIENGNGGYEGQERILKYFYIDNSYARLLFLGGLLLFIMVMVIFFWRISTLSREGFVVVALVFAVVCINGFTQESLQSPVTNILVPLLLKKTADFKYLKR
ncbi:hypothetical protein [Pediococcus pentosaceus]|uniref:hypothetical protein n=1 Tax=Pediococcus pentosaceus TaxID=1255 RepID=UPI000704F463|nr:hypothetical protein [Pediococcus pentosaceus]KRN47851.1 hypothetical protein IV86_GL001608 [Pediococcus pentosaceus]MCT3022805.1 hypothetical protein [Pediococcus pentosaceus]MDG9754514.1 hypothetical protein [Pediococcus pentosaceus]QQC02178.1 hypothetical protein I6H66_01265 [Pediococcus pentosaceus]TDG55081.1 hypothetical protein C5H55_001284 [Pediococcus pentosaceus]